MTEPVRLAKRLAEILPCSRREAEQYIEGGWVRVDGVVVEEPQFRVQSQTIALDPKARLTPSEPVTILFNKPPGYHSGEGANPALALISAATHIANDDADIHLLKKHFSGLTATTPLETDASGLVVFTQNWQVARKLGEDADSVEHEVIVEVTGELIPHGLKRLNHGLIFNGKPLPPCKVSWQNETRLRFAIKAARLGQIAHMCERVGLEVLSMKRIRIGRVPMAQLPLGQWRYLRMDERF
ncbi:MAG: rRNA pseudouridine synthase [Thiobacillaceae bacterium]